jgi:hypothetical protein
MVPSGGTLLVVPGAVGAVVDVTETGGSVAWSAVVSNDPSHLVTVSPATGTLTSAKPTALVTIKISRSIDCGGGSATACPTVKFSPGGATFSVYTGFTLPLPFVNPTTPLDPVLSLLAVTTPPATPDTTEMS